MAEYTRSLQRFNFSGLSLNAPADQVPPGKFPIATNLRSDVEGELTIRPGTALDVTVPGPVHSLFRLNDPTPLDQSIAVLRFYGTGADLYGSQPGNPAALIDSGYSGDPLTAVVAEPIGTVEPYLYVADRDRLRKIRVDGTVYPCGIDPPVAAPTTSLAQPGIQVIDNFDTEDPGAPVAWTALNTNVASAPSALARMTGVTVQQIVYLNGAGPGNAVVAFTPDTTVGNPNAIRAGMLVEIGSEDVILQETKVAIEPTTVAAALQDAVTGLWSIVPAGGLGTGVITSFYTNQVFDMSKFQLFVATQGIQPGNRQPVLGLSNPRFNPEFYTTQTASVTLTDVDFPAGCLIQVGGVWTIIRSVALGHDGTQSFLCSLPGAPNVGDPIVGTVGYRISTVNVHANGEAVTCNVISNTITAAPVQSIENADGSTTSSFVAASGGVQSLIINTATGAQTPGTAQGGPDGPTPAALQIPDHTATVAIAKQMAIDQGYDLTTKCGIAQICIFTAQLLQGEGCGLFAHFEEFNCPTSPYGPIEADAVMYPNGQFIFILGNPTGRDGPPPINVPGWSVPTPPDAYNSTKYIPVGPITNPLPTVDAGTAVPRADVGNTVAPLPLALGTLAFQALQPDDRLHCSLWFGAAVASIIKVQVLLDVDAVTNNFTQNYYLFEADGNSLVDAIQTVPNSAASTTGSAVLRNQIPTGSNPVVGTAVLKNQIPAAAISPPSVAQLPLGASQWVELTWKVRDMLRVGTDASRGLGQIQAIGVLVTIDSSLGNLEVQYGSFYATGGMNPDIFPNGAPLRYRYGFRSTITGETSNPSPQTRAESLTPLRQQITLTAPSTPAAPQANLVDWFRTGGQLTSETYVGSSAIGATFIDNFSDQDIVGGPGPIFTRFQLWPTTDQPRSGTCNVAGSIVNQVSGDTFNPQWAPGTQILINGQAYTLAASPASGTQLQIIESAGAGTGVPFTIQSPTLQGQPFPVVFGPFQGLYFGVGDPNNPGALYWTNPNDPDTASDVNFLQITASDTPLMHGFIFDTMLFVWSTEELYRIMPTGNADIPFFPEKTPCGRGLWSRWAWTMTPKGPAFLAKDGIYLTEGGTAAKSLSGPDLSNLFPHDAVPGASINGYLPPDMDQPTQLRLCYIDDYLYFDYAPVSED